MAQAQEFEYGDKVRYGGVTGEIIAADRRYRTDGYNVRDISGPGARGAARWIPTTNLTRA